MSASLSADKRKISQHDLRRIMNEHKNKISQSVKKIDSPLAKYNDSGQLSCIICDSVVRSEAVWNIHINSKKHRENIASAKKKKEDAAVFVQPVAPPPLKRPAPVTVPKPPKKLKGILKNAPPPKVPNDFFDLEQKESVEATNNEESSDEDDAESDGDTEPTPQAVKTVPSTQEETLPEGFFDDPLLDAKARHVEYKDPIEEEWEKFQKEMKEENSLSAQIIAEDQEEATAERQIDEIDEQMRNWSRVLDLEIKKEAVVKSASSRSNTIEDEEDEVSSADELEFDEYLDWRAKKLYN